MKRYKRTSRQPKMPSEKKNRMTTKMWVSVGIAVIMATSIAGFLSFGNSASPLGSVEYNNHTILGASEGWVVTVGETDLEFEYLPSDVERIPYPSDIPNWIRDVYVITMTSDPDDNLSEAIGSVEYDFSTQFSEQGKILVYAFTDNNTFGKPVVNCANATLHNPVIFFQSGNTTEITRDGNCVIATADTDYNMRRIRDRILYTHYRIIADDIQSEDTADALAS